MNEFFGSSVYFGLFLTLGGYLLGFELRKKWDIAIFHPLLIGSVSVILILLVGGIDYSVYQEGAKYISVLMTPATICLAVPLYEQYSLLKKNWQAVIAGILSGVLASGLSVLLFAFVFRFSHSGYVSFLPKSITTAIGMALSEELGGCAPITVASIVITGIFGNLVAEKVCKVFHISDPIAKGIGIGSAAHAMGTTRAMEMGEIEGAMSSLSIVVSGILTVFVANIFGRIY